MENGFDLCPDYFFTTPVSCVFLNFPAWHTRYTPGHNGTTMSDRAGSPPLGSAVRTPAGRPTRKFYTKPDPGVLRALKVGDPFHRHILLFHTCIISALLIFSVPRTNFFSFTYTVSFSYTRFLFHTFFFYWFTYAFYWSLFFILFCDWCFMQRGFLLNHHEP